MFETVDKLFLASIGAMSMTRQKAEEIFDDLVSRGKAQKTEREGFIKQLTDSAEKARKDLEDIISRQLHQALSKMDMPTRQDIARLDVKLDALAQRFEEQRTVPTHGKTHREM